MDWGLNGLGSKKPYYMIISQTGRPYSYLRDESRAASLERAEMLLRNHERNPLAWPVRPCGIVRVIPRGG